MLTSPKAIVPLILFCLYACTENIPVTSEQDITSPESSIKGFWQDPNKGLKTICITDSEIYFRDGNNVLKSTYTLIDNESNRISRYGTLDFVLMELANGDQYEITTEFAGTLYLTDIDVNTIELTFIGGCNANMAKLVNGDSIKF